MFTSGHAWNQGPAALKVDHSQLSSPYSLVTVTLLDFHWAIVPSIRALCLQNQPRLELLRHLFVYFDRNKMRDILTFSYYSSAETILIKLSYIITNSHIVLNTKQKLT